MKIQKTNKDYINEVAQDIFKMLNVSQDYKNCFTEVTKEYVENIKDVKVCFNCELIILKKDKVEQWIKNGPKKTIGQLNQYWNILIYCGKCKVPKKYKKNYKVPGSLYSNPKSTVIPRGGRNLSNEEYEKIVKDVVREMVNK